MLMDIYTKKTICPYDCPASCGFTVQTDGRRIQKTGGDKAHPVSRGLLCGKMRRYADEINSKDRILTPLKRSGGKGSGSFIPISWEEAVTEITSRWKGLIKNEGPSSIAYCYYSGVMSIIQRHCVQALFARMGACELVKTLCASAKGDGYASVVGDTGCLDPRELKNSDLYLVWGSNVSATRFPTLADLTQARKEGKRVILIEVYAEPMAPYCDEAILIRPGTDGALALAMMHVLAANDLADEPFLAEYGLGYARFKETLGAYTPQWAAEITGIPAQAITDLALCYGKASAPSILLGSGCSRYGNGSMTVRLITILSLFTGAWKRPGGGLCGCTPSGGSYFDVNTVKRPDLRSRRPERTININQLSHALTGTDGHPPLKSLYVAGSNPANSVSDQKGILEGLKREDLFTVVHERFMTDTARYADIILPAAFSAEQSDVYEAYGYCTMAAAKKIVEPAGEAKSNWDTTALLAKAMGYTDDHFRQTEEELYEKLILTPTPLSAFLTEEERKTLLQGGVLSMPFARHTDFQTPDKRFYIVNPRLPEPMPHYTACHGGSEELSLISVPSRHTLNSIFQAEKEQARKRGSMTLVMNTTDAAARGIKDGDPILCKNDLAEVEFTAQTTDLIAGGAVAAVGVYRLDQSPGGLTCNALHHPRLSDGGNATTMNDNKVNVCLKK